MYVPQTPLCTGSEPVAVWSDMASGRRGSVSIHHVRALPGLCSSCTPNGMPTRVTRHLATNGAEALKHANTDGVQ